MAQRDTLGFRRADFADDFIFGVATSSYQIEGHGQGGAGPTHWDSFAATPGNVVNAENGQIACDHYNRWSVDLDLIRDLGVKAYRFSTSWARILPEGTGQPNSEGLDFYDRLVDGLLERDIQPHVTLYHWELPSVLADKGGWCNRDIASWFADFAQVIVGRIGDRAASIAPINEPWCVAWLSHFLGHHAPGLRDIRAASRAMHHVLLAHGRAIQAMRAIGLNNLGVVANMEYAQPADDSVDAIAAAERYDAIYNLWFLDAIFKRKYPEAALQGLQVHLPQNWQDDFDVIAEPVDWIGLNYYTRKLIAPEPGPFPALKEITGPLPKTEMEWEIYPDGLYKFLVRIKDRYGDIPIFVTENGMASDDVVQAGQVHDSARTDYLSRHLKAVREAVADGVDIKGYFVWSLLDNYEWALGYDKRFGLVHVDFDTLKRTPKSSYYVLRNILMSG
ncbi:GH1 family beta-glucosidase [Parasulfitobacter algicola]|uniref:Beta-glucosidase n=1 Tax=Parasulfitobacter algicola TaxID=2614809 RepID=A0ABX2IX47_9RHOB|nr:GH1 family beta-glucosidase [Sulfitobacter algicola]NSX55765.1 beta-glucosidase [Sulfitobacter algicola]